MCGNVTLAGRLAERESEAFPERAQQLLQAMLKVSQMRGAQSGGGALQISRGGQPRQLIGKCVNSKRGDLATLLTRTLRHEAGSRPAFGNQFIAQTHVRYATAGVTTRAEAHPFRFVDAEQRGPRRVWSLQGTEVTLSVRPIETALTHNGDMDGLRFRRTALSYSELGCFLERVLGVQNRWVGDSPVLAAAIELYLTQGMWLESLRLAHHLTVAPAAPDFASVPAGLQGAERTKALRHLMSSYPAPPLPMLQEWELVAEEVFGSLGALAPATPSERSRQREWLAVEIAARFATLAGRELPEGRLAAFARSAVNNFFDNDLYVALRKLEPSLDGTFGCVVTSTLEPGCVVALSRGQPLSLGFERASQTACVVSERAALKVHAADAELAFDERIDLDLCRGEIARVLLGNDQPPRLTLYGIADGREYGSDELVATGRLVPIRNNPYVSPLPIEASDRVAADMQAIGPLLQEIRKCWRDVSSANRRTAQVFADALLGRRAPRLIVLGITNDLWLAEQFVKNLSLLLPEVRADAISSNQVLVDALAATLVLDQNTVVLAVSQAGQDFPTLAALILLRQRLSELGSDAVFVLTGEIDSLMGQAVGQSYARDARFSNHIFHNLSGFRPSEAAVATVNATQHTLVELLLFVARQGIVHGRIEISMDELGLLAARRDFTVEHAADIIGSDSPVLERQARRWSWHVLEGAVGFAALLTLLELNLQLHVGLVPSRALELLTPFAARLPSVALAAVKVVLAQADVLFYAFFAPLVIWLLRRAQNRPSFHRQGGRELLLGDTRYVHQIAWLLARRLFSLSFGFASIKPYSADCQDELIMTHEPLRGTLALIGLPDARREHLRVRGQAALMTAKQLNNSRSIAGAGAEIITISHSPQAAGGAVGAQLTLPRCELPGARGKIEQLIEGMFDSWDRLLAMQTFLERFARGVSTFWPLRYDRSRTKDQVFAPTTAAPVSAAAIYQLLAHTSERYEHAHEGPLPFDVVRSDWRGSAPPVKTTVWRSWTDSSTASQRVPPGETPE
jgi:hypothetical protein